MGRYRSFTGETPEQKQLWSEIGEVIEPSRRYDCKEYSICLGEAARMNADEMDCISCTRYRAGPEIKINLSAHIKLLIAIFLPQAYQKLSKHKIADGAFWKVMFNEREEVDP